MQKDFATQFDEGTVKMRDFTVAKVDLLASFYFYQDNLSLKFAIWKQIQERIVDI